MNSHIPRHREFSCAIVVDTDGAFFFSSETTFRPSCCPAWFACSAATAKTTGDISQCIGRELHEELRYFTRQSASNILAVIGVLISTWGGEPPIANFTWSAISRPRK